MGFLKRFLSIGSTKSRKNKNKKRQQLQADPNGRIVEHTEDPWQAEITANRLLRSSSAHFTIVSEVDYSSLPPLPHPINNLANTPPISPARSSKTAASSMKRAGTYSVKVLERVQHSLTEFPRANPPLPSRSNHQTPHNDRYEPNDEEIYPKLKEVVFTPRDRSRLFTLRQDPSVASLLNMYDDHGCLDSAIFSNTPPTPAPISEGRPQNKHSGSTLRQLLGGLDEDGGLGNKTHEGDISWAERFLQEQFATTSPNSSTSSLAPHTPIFAPFVNDLSDHHVFVNTTFSTNDASGNGPAISSMEVELSLGTEPDAEAGCIIFPAKSQPAEPKTPQAQRGAAEVFGFLTGRRKSTRERSLPLLPTPASTDVETPDGSPKPVLDAVNSSPLSQVTSAGSASEAHVYTATVTKLVSAPATINSYASREELNAYRSSSRTEDVQMTSHQNRIEGESAISRPRSSASNETRQLPVPSAPSKMPRGPRGPRTGSRSEHSRHHERSDVQSNAFSTMTNHYADRQHQNDFTDYLTVATTHQRPRSRSSGTTTSSVAEGYRRRQTPVEMEDTTMRVPSKTPTTIRSGYPRSYTSNLSSCDDKENSPSPTHHAAKPSYNRGVEPLTPTTPGRTRNILDIRNSHLNTVEAPSPASSSELSPIAREMMAEYREKRSRARDRISSRTALR